MGASCSLLLLCVHPISEILLWVPASSCWGQSVWLDPRVNLGMGSPRQVGQKIKEPVVQSQGIHTTYIIRLGDKYTLQWVGWRQSQPELPGPPLPPCPVMYNCKALWKTLENRGSMLHSTPRELKGTCWLNEPQGGDELWLISWWPMVLPRRAHTKGQKPSVCRTHPLKGECVQRWNCVCSDTWR